jgi:hypothetical protein
MEEGDLAEVSGSIDGGEPVSSLIEWKENLPVEIDSLQFEHSNYSIQDGGNRNIKLLIPSELLGDLLLSYKFNLVGDDGITRIGSEQTISFDSRYSCGAMVLRFMGRGVGARSTFSATVAGQNAECLITVGSANKAGYGIDIEELDTVQRAVWDGSRLIVNATHRSISRYLGPKSKKWPGQHSVEFRVVLAEIIASALARKVIFDRIEQPRDAIRAITEQMRLTERWLSRIHSSLLPAKEVSYRAD